MALFYVIELLSLLFVVLGFKKTWAVVNPLPQVGCCENDYTGLGFTTVSVADILCRIIATCPSGRWNMTWQPPPQKKKNIGKPYCI